MKEQKAVCISASNIMESQKNSTTYRICKLIAGVLHKKNVLCKIIDLRNSALNPCTGCGQCYEGKRCVQDTNFNCIYEELLTADYVFFVSPHYAPIPAKLCMLLEKMEQITFLHWWQDHKYRSEIYGTLAGIISHGGGGNGALENYKAMVNDTIANALDTIQFKMVPYNSKWNTGISLPVKNVTRNKGIFPCQEYDWRLLEENIEKYVEIVVQTFKSLYAIC